MTDVLSFEIRGLNGREVPLSYVMDRHVNIFFGPNGSGKTSILKILDSAMRNEPECISNVSYQSAHVKIHSVSYSAEFLLSHTKSEEGEPTRTTSTAKLVDDVDRSMRAFVLGGGKADRWKIMPEPDSEKKEIQRWRHSYLPTSRLYMDSRLEGYLAMYRGQVPGAEAVAAEDALDRNFATALQSLWSTRYGDILGRVRGIQQEALQSIFLDVLMPDAETPPRRVPARTEARVLDADRAFERMSSFLKRQSDRRIQQALGSKAQ